MKTPQRCSFEGFERVSSFPYIWPWILGYWLVIVGCGSVAYLLVLFDDSKMRNVASMGALFLAGILTSCSASQPKEALTQQPPDPMSSIWNDYGAKIDSLATPGTSIQTWRDLPPESEKLIRSESELLQILSRYNSVSTERSDHYCRLLKRARKTVHYGFELDFRALVFFDDNGQTIEAFMMSS